jgi:hypothetical protein
VIAIFVVFTCVRLVLYLLFFSEMPYEDFAQRWGLQIVLISAGIVFLGVGFVYYNCCMKFKVCMRCCMKFKACIRWMLSVCFPEVFLASTAENNPPLPNDLPGLSDNVNERLLGGILHPAPSSGSGANASNTRDVSTPTLSHSASGINITTSMERQRPTAPPSEHRTSPYPVHDAHVPPPSYESLNIDHDDNDTLPPSYTDCVANPS